MIDTQDMNPLDKTNNEVCINPFDYNQGTVLKASMYGTHILMQWMKWLLCEKNQKVMSLTLWLIFP